MSLALRNLPSVDKVLSEGALSDVLASTDRARVTRAVRETLAAVREAVRSGGDDAAGAPSAADIAARAAGALAQAERTGLRAVWNCTGTLVHTNLGRATLPEAAVKAVVAAATRASNLEYDIEAGKRGDRDAHLQDLICELTGAEAATVVNNNAAAVLLVLNTLALGKEVPVSRGQLVEIGDAFRIPDIMTRSGAVLREVGTTNRTHPRDFADVCGPDTGVLMEVHTSNYVIEGFTAEVSTRALADIAHAHGLALVVDLGSGTLLDLEDFGLPHEPTVQEALAAGADIVTFSGDKLMGGPQAGMIVGTRALIDQVKRNPLRRALRVDKLRIAALAETLRLYRHTESLRETLPTLAAMVRPLADIEALGERLLARGSPLLPPGFAASVVVTSAQPGSGALPGRSLESRALALADTHGDGARAGLLERALRTLSVPVIGRVKDGTVLLDLRALHDEAGFIETLQELPAAFAKLVA